jgi:hypothetical protein
LNGLLNDHFPRPATATWGAFNCLDGARGAASARQLVGLGSGLRLRLLHLRNDEARQDATVLLNGLYVRLRNNRSGVERRPQRQSFCSTCSLMRLSGLL